RRNGFAAVQSLFLGDFAEAADCRARHQRWRPGRGGYRDGSGCWRPLRLWSFDVACRDSLADVRRAGWLLQAASNEAANQVLDRLNSAATIDWSAHCSSNRCGELRIVAGDRVTFEEAWERPVGPPAAGIGSVPAGLWPGPSWRYLREAGGANHVDRLLRYGTALFTVASSFAEAGVQRRQGDGRCLLRRWLSSLDVTTGDLAADGDG
uniref:DUF608 domain-containing protein n=1 Tax=Macrostomum lignano TaxID=282301 RepID=A0A1I8FJH9_9PLAT